MSTYEYILNDSEKRVVDLLRELKIYSRNKPQMMVINIVPPGIITCLKATPITNTYKD